MYSITLHQTHLNSTLQYHAINDILENILSLSLLWNMALQVQNLYAQTNANLDDITYSEGTQCDSVQFYFLTEKNSILNLYDAYQTAPCTSSIFLHIQSTQKRRTANFLATIYNGYRTAFKERRIKITKETSVLLKPILADTQQLALIIVPKPLQQKVFSHFYTVPTVSHMVEYKALYRMWLRFSIQASKRFSPHESKAVLTDYHIMYGRIVNKNFIFLVK